MKVTKDHPLVGKIVHTYPSGNINATYPLHSVQHFAIVNEIIDDGVAGTIAFRNVVTNLLHEYEGEIGWQFNVNIENVKIADNQISLQWEVFKYKKLGQFCSGNY